MRIDVNKVDDEISFRFSQVYNQASGIDWAQLIGDLQMLEDRDLTPSHRRESIQALLRAAIHLHIFLGNLDELRSNTKSSTTIQAIRRALSP